MKVHSKEDLHVICLIVWFFSEKEKLYQNNPEFLDILMIVFQDDITSTYRMYMIWAPDGKWLVLCLFDRLDPSTICEKQQLFESVFS